MYLHEYAGFWLRVVASFIDALVLGVIGAVVGAILGHGLNGDLLGAVIGWLYNAWMESSEYQGSLGKLALGLAVTDEYGERISFGRATGRHFGKIISGLIFGIGFLMAGWTERKQALHDMMAGCLVIVK